ncbi:glycosyltransferase family 4 protein [Flavobacterium sp. CYK-55]|uniref:glycosyltransferase family 4 protein n=1 Tax=Flavobacterium sp. CYK-55 TaxID=2835529 RepID=UPI001BD04448|nr:glycosyltransferase family 4 protein [Flavobacterium sp. CYK-55]MBS7788235.1 glycosyltransferase family 4 protein [Flavobacterium sp. CYK-55]
MVQRKILFLGETYRADAITWIKGLRELGSFEVITWELKTPSNGLLNRFSRILEYATAWRKIRKIARLEKPDMVIAERTTSYGFLAALSGIKPAAIAQQGISDLWPENSLLYPLKRMIQSFAFHNVDLIHAWGPAMTVSMKKNKVDMSKVMVLPKGIDLTKFTFAKNQSQPKIHAIVTRSLLPEYRHSTIIKAFGLLQQQQIPFELTIVGDGPMKEKLQRLTQNLDIHKNVHFVGRISNESLPKLLAKANFYISMPITEGVSSSLFEAMAVGCYPIVSDIPGNQSWISHRENGQLVTVDQKEILAQEIIWALKNEEFRKQVVAKNRKFVEEKANYTHNMKQISERYHQMINHHQNQ